MRYDTLAVQLHIDQINLPGGGDFDWSEQHVSAVVEQSMATTDQELETPIQFRAFATEVVSPANSWSQVAYIECEDGYFFVTDPLTDQYSVVYNRWD